MLRVLEIGQTLGDRVSAEGPEAVQEPAVAFPSFVLLPSLHALLAQPGSRDFHVPPILSFLMIYLLWSGISPS